MRGVRASLDRLRVEAGLSGTLIRAAAIALVCVVAFQFVMAAARATIDRSSSAMGMTADVETIIDDAAASLELRSVRLAFRLSMIRDSVPIPGEASGGVDAYWRALVESARVEPDETLALANGAGELVAAIGATADDLELTGERLRAYCVVGRAGQSGTRVGLVDSDGDGVFAASIRVPDVPANEVGAAALTDPRIVLISPMRGFITAPTVDGTAVELYSIQSSGLPGDYAEATAELWRHDGRLVERTRDGARAFQALEDPSGRQSFLLVAHATVPPSTLFSAASVENLAWEFLAALVAVAIVLRVVKKRLLNPIDRLERHASRIARTERGMVAFHAHDEGEVGDLGRSLDEMLQKLDAERRAWVRSARIAGMSDVSMSVVHSAGNILNSVNVSTKLLKRELASICVKDLCALVAEVEQHDGDLDSYMADDDNGQYMVPFLKAMSESLLELQTRCEVELEAIDDSIQHVIGLVRSQEKYAIGASLVEAVRVEEIIEQAISVSSLACERSVGIEIERSYTPLGEIHVDRQKLTSILINIIANAVESVSEDDSTNKHVEVSTYPMDSERFVIEVTDRGVGIRPEHLDDIFNSTFSTKDRSAGLGLHTTANLCKELDIAIGVVSDGPGSGATFKLRVPFAPAEDVEGPSAPLPAGEAATESVRTK